MSDRRMIILAFSNILFVIVMLIYSITLQHRTSIKLDNHINKMHLYEITPDSNAVYYDGEAGTSNPLHRRPPEATK